ncbi:hypothetical protein G6F57_020659 [Rhizopus arrhizus]|nr:hypothetical protein G6F57_020659 [Rhizopus arrhizus]
MSGSHTSLPVSSSNMSDFAQYLLQERAKSIPVAPYELHQSLRIWLKNFTQQATVHGITDMNLCAPYLPRYMPLELQEATKRICSSTRSKMGTSFKFNL